MSSPNARLLARWEAILCKNASRVALLENDGRPSATFLEIESKSVGWVKKLGHLPPRSVVGIQLRNHPDWLPILLALWRLEHVILPLDVSLQPELIGIILATASARLLINETELRPLEPGSETPFLPSTSLCKVTSGTTGAPRLVEFSCDQLLADADQIVATMGLCNDDINFGVISFSHSYGFSNLLTPLLVHGISLVVVQDHFPASILDGLSKTRATVLPGIPFLYQSLVRLKRELPPTVRLCITAGAPLPGDLAREFQAQKGRKLHSFYGASECGGICYDASEEIELPDGYVGTALEGVRLVYDAESRRIVVKSAAVGERYFPEVADGVLANGEFQPSDLLAQSAGGFRITGRISDFINISGKKLDPQLVEAVIENIPGISRAVVCGLEHRVRGETAIAVVETTSITMSEILIRCRQILAPWQIPSDVWIVEQIPLTERGKINRRVLAESYLAKDQI